MDIFTQSSASNSPFHTTRWTRVCQAKADSAEGHKALADLCDAYYEAVVAFLRFELRDSDAAREMSHAFFTEVLSGGTIHNAERERGRFRSYLLGAIKHFLSRHRQDAMRLKRGGGAVLISLDEDLSAMCAIPDARQPTPSAAFDRQWAITTVARALEVVRAECILKGRAEFFQQVKPWLTGEGTYGDQSAWAAACGMTPASLKMAVRRLKQRFRECLKEEIASTLEDPVMVDTEMQVLFAALVS